MMKRNKAIEKKYGRINAKGKTSGSNKSVYHKAIRTELLGGNVLLDLNEVMFLLAGHKNRSKECRDFAAFCSTNIGIIKDEMVEEITRRYTEPVGRKATQKFIEKLDEIINIGGMKEDTMDALLYIREQLGFMIAEMNGEIATKIESEADSKE
jgi:hypothetical protein